MSLLGVSLCLFMFNVPVYCVPWLSCLAKEISILFLTRWISTSPDSGLSEKKKSLFSCHTRYLIYSTIFSMYTGLERSLYSLSLATLFGKKISILLFIQKFSRIQYYILYLFLFLREISILCLWLFYLAREISILLSYKLSHIQYYVLYLYRFLERNLYSLSIAILFGKRNLYSLVHTKLSCTQYYILYLFLVLREISILYLLLFYLAREISILSFTQNVSYTVLYSLSIRGF